MPRCSRATILCEHGSIHLEDLGLWSAAPAQADGTDLDVLEQRTIERVMQETHGNKVHAARKLGISRMQLYTRLRKYGLASA